MDTSLVFLQYYANAECVLQNTACDQNKSLRVIYGSEHLAMEQDGLVGQQTATLIMIFRP